MDDDDIARMKRIEEKHEALAQSSELLHHEVMQQARNIDKLGDKVDKLADKVDKLAVESAIQQKLLIEVLSAMRDLIGVVTGHERRIQNLESR